ncbi:hypothetical protein [Micromonospora luteifusca]|uniref:hypothetical protein n=1 Tax=Micromonospora luteifusca TaxID=709860 RepID=UPI0033AFE81F
MTARPSPGDLLVIDGRASAQFAGEGWLTFRIVPVRPPDVPALGLVDRLVINRRDDATAKREVYVQPPASARSPALT